MKAYRTINGKQHVANVPDGAVCIELGSTFDPSGQDLPPIDLIDRQKGIYRRRGGQPTAIPDRTFRAEDVTWEPGGEELVAR